eukprot:Sdes_comp20946_c0_seq10m18539
MFYTALVKESCMSGIFSSSPFNSESFSPLFCLWLGFHISEEVEKWVSEYSLRLGKFSSVYKELVKLTQIMKPGLMSLYSLQADLVFHKDQVESDIQQYDHLILRYEGFFEVYHRLILEIYRRRMEVAKIGNMISSFHEKITAVMKGTFQSLPLFSSHTI